MPDTNSSFTKGLNAQPIVPEDGSILLVALGTILVVSIICGGVLMNATTRYNATTKQVKGWKEALYAAEAGGDIAFAEVRKVIRAPGTEFTGADWTSPNPATGPWTYVMPNGIGQSGALTASVTVDRFTTIGGKGMYRIRSVGSARLLGLRRTGMDDSVTGFGSNFSATGLTRGNGDSLLRKIDFSFDHYIATYGDGDGNNMASVPVPSDANGNPLAKISRRVELIAVPVIPIKAGLNVGGSFRSGNGQMDSYDSKNGAYPGESTATDPSAPFYSDSRDCDISCGTSSWSQGMDWIFGDVTTNGGNASTVRISGVVDNNVPLQPITQSYPTFTGAIRPPTRTFTPTQFTSGYDGAPWYQFSSLPDAVINNPDGTNETYVNVMVDGDIETTMTIARGVNVRFYFTGNLNLKGKDYYNNNVDGSPSTNPSRAGHIQFYGVSPTAPATQKVDITPPGDMYQLVYAPGADFNELGVNDFYGAITCKNFYGNGGTGFHFDKQLAVEPKALDYRIASYIEDVR